jgi:hypothetical protein
LELSLTIERRLKYITTTSATNKKLNYSFALVFYEGNHLNNESTYFKAEVQNETTGGLLPVCNQSVSIVGPTTSPADSMSVSCLEASTFYRKWQLFTVDLSSLPIGTNVSVNFEVGGCTQGGHFAYAYVDAECGAAGSGGGTDFILCNMCPGSTNASLNAPIGYISYKWYDPSNNLISGAISNTLSLSNPILGDIYSVQITGHNGCVETKTIAIANSSATINNIAVTGSCISGNSGSATVNPSGSSGTYSYTWTSVASGSVISSFQSATNLSPGNYSVVVSSGTCGQASSTITVPTISPSLLQQSKTFCGNNTFIAANAGTNYQWYFGNTPVAAPNGANDTLFIPNAVHGNAYTVVYTNTGNCKDSIRYVLNQIPGGSVNMNNITNVCSGNSNGSAVLALNPVNSGPYTYSVNSAGGPVSNASTSSTTYSLTNLAAGTYTSIVTDGNCAYTHTFSINVVQTNFTLTPGTSSSCSSADTARINFNFGNPFPTNCGLSFTGNCSTPNSIQLGFGTAANSAQSFPAIYSNWYRNARHQLLYTAAELLAAGVQPGKITSVSFDISAVSGTTVYPDFTIRMKCTSDPDLASPTFDNTGLTQVYYNASQNIALGWNVHQFQTAYEWDGVSNLLIDICTSLMPSFTANSSSPYTITPFTSVRWFNSDATIACMTTSSPTGYAPNNTYRPNIKFENCGASASSAYSISVSSNGTIVQNYNNDSIKVVPVITPTADIVYTITVTNPEGGCTASQTFTMSSSLSAVTTVTNASCGSCPTGSAQVIVNCGAGSYTYLWNPGGQTTSSISGLLPGCYTVTVTDANLTATTEEACVTFATKLDESLLANGLNVYPNPSNGIFNLLSETILDNLEITITNPLGQIVGHESLKNTNQASIDISKLSEGVYYMKTNTIAGTKLFKLILE